MVAQVLAPEITWAIKEGQNYPKEDNKLVEVGKTGAENYPKLTNKVILDIQKETTLNSRKNIKNKTGVLPFNTPYLPGQDIPDEDKPRIVGKVFADFKTIGLDGGTFDWEGVFGKDSNGNPGKAKLVFQQWLNNKETNVSYELEVSKDGTYSWKDWQGEPARIPLYSKSLEPYTYSVYLDQDVSEKVKLLTYRIAGTPSGGGFEKDPETGLNIANIVIDLSIQQVASTKFVSEWHTGLAKDARPPVEGEFDNKIDEFPGYFPFSLENNGQIIIRNDFVNNSDYEDPGYTEFGSSSLVKKPEVKVTEGLEFADENDEEGSPTYNLDEANKTITTLDKKHKFKYDFTYDVINGGKLSMTEIISVTFDANGGKFASITEEGADQKIVKEVDYEGTLTDKAEDPTREGKTFKGWSITKGGAIATDADFANIKEAKTFYAIWENNDIKVEELTVSESFNNGTDYVNDFIPTLDTLKGQVEIKDANGVYQKLKDGDSLQILDDSGNPIADDDLKDNLYDKLKEDSSTEISRNLTLKAKVNFADGTSQEIEIPIKVIKNIYEGTSTGGKPSYVPENYVKVTVDPTDKATNSQKTYYYVNPAAKVVIPGSNPTGTGDNVFTKWLIKGTTEEYKLADKPRHMFTAEITIEAQYDKEGKGIIKIAYVDENGNEISADYHKDGVDYPSKKEGKLNSEARDEEFPKPGPDFKGYIYSSRDDIKGKYYKDQSDPDNLDTVKYSYFKKVTTDEPKNKFVYFPVIFDANGGEFEAAPKDKKTVYVYFNGNDATVEKVTFKEVLDEFEKAYSNPTKDGFDFKEWQDKADKGSAVGDGYEIQFKDWNWEADPVNGYVPETFYAHYGKASALVKYLDLNGKEIDAKFKFISAEDGKDVDGEGNKLTLDKKYPTEKEGTLDEKIASDVFTAKTAPTLIGYKFNRIELNPKDGKYAMDNKATIKIYYEKLPDVIPSTGNDKPDGYVTVTFEPGTNGTLDGETKFYVNPKADPVKTMAEITQPTIKANQGFKVADTKWKDANDAALDTATQITKDLTYTAQYTGLDDIIPDTTPDDDTDKPDGYVTVKFLPGDHGTLGGTTKYYVNPKADPVKTMQDITEPTVTANTGYEVADPKWKDAEDNALVTATKITKDLTYTAQYKFTKDVVPQGPGEGKPVVPDNYLKVTFKEGDHGIISASQTTIYWVNPDKEVTLTAPAVTANADYKHTAWKYNVNSQDKTTSGTDATKTVKDTFAADTDITAQYKKKVVDTEEPKVPGTNTPDSDYVKVDFKAETHGKIKDGETSVYWVLKNEIVELKTPAVEAKANYAFKEWKEPVQTSYKKDTTHKAVFAYTGDNVVPQKPGDEKPDVPADFVQVIFNQGTNGTIATGATTTYWVKPNVEVTVTAPKVEANPEYKHVAWTYKLTPTATEDKEVKTLESVTDTFTENKTLITAKYLKKVLEEEPQTDKDAYVKVTFKAEANGKLADGTTEKSYWVLKDTPVTLTEAAVTANPGWKFIKYDPAVQISYSKDTEHKAQYKKIIVTEDPKDKDYVKVTFDPAAQGSIKAGSNAEVWVLKDETIDPKDITPQLDIKEKYALEKWDPAVQNKYDKDTTHKAIYKYNGDDVVPQKPGEDKPNVPNNFVKVTFVAGKHGSIANTETYIYWVNPEKEVTLNAPKLTANVDYKHMAWTYDDKTTSGDNCLTTVKDTFANETTITAKYLKKVLTEDPNDTENYVKVTFVAGDNGTIANTETTTYWVLRSTDVKVTPPKVTPNSGYTFTEWNPAVKTNYDADTTHTAQYNEKDKVLTEDPKDTDYIKVTFNANGGKIGMEDAKDVWVLKDIATFADAKAKIATPIKEKATFKEWQDKASEGTAVEGTKVLYTANETFYAAYTDYDKIIEDPTTNTPEDGYVRLTFDATDAGRIGTADGEQKKVIDVLKGTPYTDKDLKDKLDEIKAVPVKADGGSTVKDTEKAFDKWTPAVPTTGYVKTETFTASYKKFIPKQEKIDITATKAWQDAEGNTPNFTTPEVKFELWRKAGQAGTEEIVKEATALENNSVTFSKVDKYDANGVEYIYFVKEVFTNPAEKENWTVSGEGTLNLTNKLKGDSTDPGTDKVGKLTITKKLENEPVALKAFSMMRAPAPAASEQLKFKFKVTGPYGYEETFELAANESKTLDKLAYGDYKVEETDTKGYKAEYSKTKETLTKENPNGSITVTNKNKIPGENETNDNIIDVTVTKVWVGGEKPSTEIQLWRTGYGLNGKVFQEKVDSFTTAAKGDDTQTHKFEKLAKQDPSGKEFTYYAVEENVPANYTASYSEDNLTVTNTYNAPAKKYTVIYKAGSSTATGTMAADTDARGTYTVKANGFTNDGYTFKGWKVGDTTQIVQPGDTINVTANVTLTAIWEKTTTPPTPDPDKPNPDKPNPWDPKPWNPNYPDLPYIPRYPEIRYETIVQEKIVKVPVPIADNAYVKEVRYMQGFMGDFRPKDGLTRAEAAQILANALVEDGYKYNKDFKLPYKDIGEAWYTRAVKIVTEAKVFAGYDDGNFKPQDKITRNEWIATLKRFQELGDVSGNHMKLKDGHWAMAEIEAAYKEGWLKIYSDGLATYEGDKFIPREEVAAVSNKAFNRVLDKTYIINNDKNLITYKDVKKDMWSYEDILCASNTFLYKKDLYRAHWIKEDNNQFNINTDGFEIVKAKFQRNPR